MANHTGDEMLTVAGDRARRADEEKRNRERRPMATRVGIGGPQGRRLALWWVFPRGLGENERRMKGKSVISGRFGVRTQ